MPKKGIVLTEFGDSVVAIATGLGTALDVDAHAQLIALDLRHECNERGRVQICRVSDRYYVVVCRACNLRVSIPKHVTTWSGLQDYFKRYNEPARRPEGSITD